MSFKYIFLLKNELQINLCPRVTNWARWIFNFEIHRKPITRKLFFRLRDPNTALYHWTPRPHYLRSHHKTLRPIIVTVRVNQSVISHMELLIKRPRFSEDALLYVTRCTVSLLFCSVIFCSVFMLSNSSSSLLVLNAHQHAITHSSVQSLFFRWQNLSSLKCHCEGLN